MDDRVAGGAVGGGGIWRTGDTRSVLERPERLPHEADAVAAAVIRVRVLGKPAILGVPEDQHVRASSVEFLTYLIARGGTADQYEIVADLMPELPRRTAAQRMHTYTYNLRQIFARLGGGSGYLRLHRHRYVLDRASFDVDLWTMLDAVADAGAAPTRRHVSRHYGGRWTFYTGPFADGAEYLWLRHYQDLVRREYVNAVISLAESLAAPALAVVAEGRCHHPDDEWLTARW